MAKKPSKSDVATARKVLKQAGLTGESRKGKAAKTVKAADTSRGEGRRGRAAETYRAGRGTMERLSESGKTSSQTINEGRRNDIEAAREMIKAGQRVLKKKKKALKSDPTGSKESGKYVKPGDMYKSTAIRGRRSTQRPGTRTKPDPGPRMARHVKGGDLDWGDAYYVAKKEKKKKRKK